MDRRHFLELSAWLATASAAVGCKQRLSTSSSVKAGDNKIAQLASDPGVASGEPSANSVVLWTRLPNALIEKADTSVEVSYDVSESQSFDVIVAKGKALAEASADHTIKVKVENLPSNKWLYYRFKFPDNTDLLGRTRTLPANGLQTLKFAVISCQAYHAGFYTAFRHLAEEDVDVIIHLGDSIYSGGGKSGDGANVRTDPISCHSLTDYRKKYRLYLSDHYWRDLRALFPMVMLWDDNEIIGNWNGSDLKDSQRALRDSAVQAFAEYNPVLLNQRSATTTSGWREYSWGDLAKFYSLDTRSFRGARVCKDDKIANECTQIRDPRYSMLGPEQRQWLQDRLSANSGKWQFILSSVMFMPWRLNQQGDLADSYATLFNFKKYQNGSYLNFDSWDGYMGERQSLIEFISESSPRKVVILSGDLHNAYSANLGKNLTTNKSPTVLHEFLGPSITSTGLAERAYSNASDYTVINDFARNVVLKQNPHMTYCDLRYHGYMTIEASPSSISVSYRGVSTIKSTSSEILTRAKFEVAASGGPMKKQFSDL